MPTHTDLTPDQAALLAGIWIILAGAALMPALVVLARLAVRFAPGVLLGQLLTWAGVALAALGIGFAAPSPAAAETCAPVTAASTAPKGACLDLSITQTFLRVTGKSKRPMPAWLLDSAAGIYSAYKTYKNGQKVEEAARIANAALAEIAKVRAEIEAGRVLTEEEQRLTRTRLEAHGALIEGFARRIAELEDGTARLKQRTDQVMGIVTRRGCLPLHAWDRNLRRCTNRQ